jgi:MFS family permease
MEPRASLTSLLRQPPYRRLWVARTVSQWGDAFNTVALALLVYSLTGSGLGVSAVVVAEIVPVLALAPVAGALVDRLSRVRVMIAADLARAALAFALPFLDDQLLAVYAIAFALSAGAVFFNPAAQSVLPSLVGERDLVAANSGLWTAAVISQIVLAPLAGVVVATLGYTEAFWINAASYLLSALALRRLTVPAAAAPTRAPPGTPRPARGSPRWPGTRCYEHWPPPSSWLPCPPGPPARCWWCWPVTTSPLEPGTTGSCSVPSVSAPPLGRCCCPG